MDPELAMKIAPLLGMAEDSIADDVESTLLKALQKFEEKEVVEVMAQNVTMKYEDRLSFVELLTPEFIKD